MADDTAYAPYGENYAGAGSQPSLSDYTGQLQDTMGGLYDFLYRRHNQVQGRWISPDPAGLGVVNFSNPQSWNRYAYVLNNPLSLTDPLGLDCIYLNDDNSLDHVDPGDCASPTDNGYYVDNTGIIPNSVSTSADGSQIYYNWSNPQNPDEAGSGVVSTGSPIPTSGSVVIGAPFDQAVSVLGQVGITPSATDNQYNIFHPEEPFHLRDSNPMCSLHVTLNPNSGTNGNPTTGWFHTDLFNPMGNWPSGPAQLLSWPAHGLADILPSMLNEVTGSSLPVGGDACGG